MGSNDFPVHLINVILQSEGVNALRDIPDGCINCCVTSPPYWGLRDYGTAVWKGGDPECNHIADQSKTKKFGNKLFNQGRPSRESTKVKGFYAPICPKCGAVREDSQIGLEQTPEEYVDRLVKVFREVRRVLRDDGTLWLNLGDSYAGSGKGPAGNFQDHGERHLEKVHSNIIPDGLKPKDLVGIPWRVAFALQADGWYLRQDIIWHKPNPMPESVTDRCTKAHEYIFMLSKHRKYYYDNEAIKEDAVGTTPRPRVFGSNKQEGTMRNDVGNMFVDNGKKNRRSVWAIPTKPYSGAHFATFPPELIRPCVLAGCPRGGIVLDPFMGAGTTAIVALEEGRNYLGLELKPEYIALSNDRIKKHIEATGKFDPQLF